MTEEQIDDALYNAFYRMLGEIDDVRARVNVRLSEMTEMSSGYSPSFHYRRLTHVRDSTVYLGYVCCYENGQTFYRTKNGRNIGEPHRP
jgi:hypothetical protein